MYKLLVTTNIWCLWQTESIRSTIFGSYETTKKQKWPVWWNITRVGKHWWCLTKPKNWKCTKINDKNENFENYNSNHCFVKKSDYVLLYHEMTRYLHTAFKLPFSSHASHSSIKRLALMTKQRRNQSNNKEREEHFWVHLQLYVPREYKGVQLYARGFTSDECVKLLTRAIGFYNEIRHSPAGIRALKIENTRFAR